MLLRRMTEHIKNQNWLAIFIDFVIVVVGVFIGIQVANWNDDRLENKLSEDFTQRLREDIIEEAWDFQYMIEYYTDVQQNAERVLADLEDGVKLNDIELVIAAYRASQINIITRRRATYDELVSIGKIDLIKDKLLRKLLQGFMIFHFMNPFIPVVMSLNIGKSSACTLIVRFKRL